jgi:hypothetical protein
LLGLTWRVQGSSEEVRITLRVCDVNPTMRLSRMEEF